MGTDADIFTMQSTFDLFFYQFSTPPHLGLYLPLSLQISSGSPSHDVKLLVSFS